MTKLVGKRTRKPRVDIAGQVFGRLTAVRWAGNSRWVCLCECGKEAVILTANLRRGNSKSCGCSRNAASAGRATTHGLSNTLAYKTWLGIRRRCRGKTCGSYAEYGGRGIDVCQEWYESVEKFIAYVGQPPSSEHTLDRIDNNKGYAPGNVRWATSLQQARNRSVCVPVSFQGKEFATISEFVEWLMPQINVKYSSLDREIAKQLRRRR